MFRLREQWRDELRDRAGLTARIVDADWQAAASRELPPDVNPWSLPGLYLASVDFIKQGDVLRGAERVTWDVLVVDEAHVLAAGSERAEAARRLGARSRIVLLLTATPHSGSAIDFETLCRVGWLGPIGSPEGVDDPLVIFRRSRLVAGRGGGRRRVHVLRVAPTEDERRMHELLARYVRRVESRTDQGDAARLAMVVLRKRACSSAWSLARSVTRRWRLIAEQSPPAPEQASLPFWSSSGRDVGNDEGDEEPGVVLGAVGLPVRHERVWLAIIAEVARRAARSESKIRAVGRLLRRTAASGESAVVFTEYRDTLAHLATRLDRSVTTVMLHGGLSAEARRVALARFGSGEARVLLTTDAAGEGLNLQGRCRVVVQVELPWNPTRVEQRIGRVDRLGQARTVHAWQLVSAGTYEQRVLRSLRDRLGRIAVAIGEGSAVPVRRGVSDLARRVTERLRVMRAVRGGATGGGGDGGGGVRRMLRRGVERRPPWITVVRRVPRGPFRAYRSGFICLWRVRVRAGDGVLIETRIVCLHVPLPMSMPGREKRCLTMVCERLVVWRDAMQRVVAREAARASVRVWEAERAWRVRWRMRDAAIVARAGVDDARQVQPLLFPELQMAEPEWRRMAGRADVVEEEARVDEGDEAGLTTEQELLLVLVLSPGA